VRLNDECFSQAMYGDMLGYIKANGELVIIELPKNVEGHHNVYCTVSIANFLATPWGNFNNKSLGDKRLSPNALQILKEIKKHIKINKKINNSFARPV